jgi:hypothetical protein
MNALSRIVIQLGKLGLLLALGAMVAHADTLTPLAPSYVEGLKSLNGNQTAVIQFNNFTGLTVDVSWIDYSGVEQLYATLLPGQSFVQDTFITHPWVVENHATDAGIVGFLADTAQSNSTTTPDIANITTPEPSALLLVASGLAGLVGFRRKRAAFKTRN